MSPASAPPAPPKTGGAGSAPAGPIENAEIAKERKEVKLSISLVCNNGLRLHQQALAPGVESQAPGPRRNWRSGRIEKISSGKQIYTKLLTPPRRRASSQCSSRRTVVHRSSHPCSLP